MAVIKSLVAKRWREKRGNTWIVAKFKNEQGQESTENVFDKSAQDQIEAGGVGRYELAYRKNKGKWTISRAVFMGGVCVG